MLINIPQTTRRQCSQWRIIDAETGEKVCDAKICPGGKLEFDEKLKGTFIVEGYDIDEVESTYEILRGKFAIIYKSGFTVYRDDKKFNEPRETNVTRSPRFTI